MTTRPCHHCGDDSFPAARLRTRDRCMERPGRQARFSWLTASTGPKRFSGQTASDVLVAALDHESSDVRRAAAKALRSAGVDPALLRASRSSTTSPTATTARAHKRWTSWSKCRQPRDDGRRHRRAAPQVTEPLVATAAASRAERHRHAGSHANRRRDRLQGLSTRNVRRSPFSSSAGRRHGVADRARLGVLLGFCCQR